MIYHPGPNTDPARGEECAVLACVATYRALAETPLKDAATLVHLRNKIIKARGALRGWMGKRELGM